MPGDSDRHLRYAGTIDPVATDGRGVDPRLGVLTGEASGQEAKAAEQVEQLAPKAWDQVPSVDEGSPSYYDRPLLKESVWTLDIPLYYFAGGAAGAALALGAAVQLAAGKRDKRDLRRFAQECHWIGVIGSTAGAALLIHDLGRPSRFLYMLRVFRPTSPMNIGAWILSGAAPTAIATALFINRPGFTGKIGEITGYASGVFGAALATYTGVLVANSAVPIWQPARRWMPVLFAASAMASAGAILQLLHQRGRAARIVAICGTAGRIAELVSANRVEESALREGRTGEPFRSGAPSVLWKAAKVLTVASLVLSLAPGKSAQKRRASAILAAAGSLTLRFAVHYLTNASARDPRASFDQQRREQ